MWFCRKNYDRPSTKKALRIWNGVHKHNWNGVFTHVVKKLPYQKIKRFLPYAHVAIRKTVAKPTSRAKKSTCSWSACLSKKKDKSRWSAAVYRMGEKKPKAAQKTPKILFMVSVSIKKKRKQVGGKNPNNEKYLGTKSTEIILGVIIGFWPLFLRTLREKETKIIGWTI